MRRSHVEFPDRGRIAPQAIPGEYTRSSVVRVGQCLLQEQLGCLAITSFREVEIDGLAIAVYGAEQVHPFPAMQMKVSSMCQVDDFRLTSPGKRWLSSGPYVCTHRQMDVWSTARPRSAMSSSRWRKLKQNPQIPADAVTITCGSNFRFQNSGGRNDAISRLPTRSAAATLPHVRFLLAKRTSSIPNLVRRPRPSGTPF